MDTYILFTVAGTSYAAPSARVRHVEMVDEVTSVPNAAQHVEGVVFSRGQVVPVVNLRVRFGFERAPHSMRSRLLVIEVGGRNVGLLVDDAREFMGIPDGAIQPPNMSITGVSGNYITGIATLGDRIVLMLDVDEVIGKAPVAA